MGQEQMTFTIGQHVEWHKTFSDNGPVHIIPVTIRRIGRARITVDMPIKSGGTRRLTVRPHNLRPMRSGYQPD
jgi:hypothetical protein